MASNYPPGTGEHDPRAPWNRGIDDDWPTKEELDAEEDLAEQRYRSGPIPFTEHNPDGRSY